MRYLVLAPQHVHEEETRTFFGFTCARKEGVADAWCGSSRNFRLADCVTLGNGFCGALSLFSSAHYLLTSDQTYLWSVSLLTRGRRCKLTRLRLPCRHALAYPLAGMFFDALDGKVARWRNESSMLGQELDSLADSVRPAPPYPSSLL